jgi:glutamine amidotransferase
MCQLLGMNCNVPTDICFSFEGFSRRGGGTDDHSDGWGIAFFEHTGCRMFLDDKPSVTSPIAQLVKNYPIHSINVIAHIRKATCGRVALENTHPFQRELWGLYWVFAHNGTLQNFNPPPQDIFRPVGETDSERAYCAILNALRQRFPERMPEPVQLRDALAEIISPLARYGTFNFLLSNGRQLFAHCATDLCYVVRQAPFSLAHLVDEDVSIDFSAVTTPKDRVAVIATQPLTDNETWTNLVPGELLMFEDGAPQRR